MIKEQKVTGCQFSSLIFYYLNFNIVQKTIKFSLLTMSFLFFILITNAQNQIGIFINHSDIGKPKLSGDALFNNEDQTYNLKGSGYNIWFGRDEFHYAYNKIKGDFILTGNFKMKVVGKDPHRKIEGGPYERPRG